VFVSIKPLHVSVFFSWPSSGGPPLCFVPLLFLPLICVHWVFIITPYVAACVCHLCVFGVLVCWWSACELSPTDKNTKHTQMTYTCGHILRNNTNSTNANQCYVFARKPVVSYMWSAGQCRKNSMHKFLTAVPVLKWKICFLKMLEFLCRMEFHIILSKLLWIVSSHSVD